MGRVERVRDELKAARVLKAAGFLRRDHPRTTLEILKGMRTFGQLGAALPTAALRYRDQVAVADEKGTITFGELDRRVNALAHALRSRGVREGTGVAILVRNHRGFHEAFFATSKLGARAILLNTDFAGPQLVEVVRREGAQLLVHDEEYTDLVAGVSDDLPLGRVLAWTDAGVAEGDTLDSLVASAGTDAPPPKPAEKSSFVILTSGTTGTPKGANRTQVPSLTPLGALMGSVPYRAGEPMVIAAPVFHSLGFTHAIAAVGLGATAVLRRRFKPGLVLDDIATHRATSAIVVPVMLRRIVEEQERSPRDVSSLRIVLVAGSQLGGTLALRAMDALGDVVYNLYGSTEVAFATIASPADLRRAPDTVGPATLGSRLQILDAGGRPVPTGTTGRIFVRNAVPFEGYTGGGSKEVVDGMMSSGDLGHLDASGLLFIDGRDDSMIVCGGENVFPDEIEELLSGHEAIEECAAIGVDDEEMGQRLRVFVVRRDGAELSEDDVRDHVRANLARFKVPRDVVFVDQLPRNPTGKVLKRELAKLPV